MLFTLDKPQFNLDLTYNFFRKNIIIFSTEFIKKKKFPYHGSNKPCYGLNKKSSWKGDKLMVNLIVIFAI